MTSVARWFHNQHPSDVEAYNDAAAAERLPDDADCFEVTLNDDRGTQYIETHQLAVPPVRCLDPRDLAFLARIAARARMVSHEEHARGEVIVEAIVLKAQLLLKCAHDGLEATGLAGCGELFAAPMLLDEGEEGALAMLGSVSPGGGGGADINEVDVRARYMQLGPDWDDGVGEGALGWRYPAADEEEDAGSSSGGESGEAGAGGDGGAQQGMKRVASWTQDKFTAMPTRTAFPQLSEINHLMHDDAVGGPAAVAPGVGSLEGAPTPVAPLLEGASAGEQQVEAVSPPAPPGAAAAGRLGHVFSAPTPPRPGDAGETSPVAMSTPPGRGDGGADSPDQLPWAQPGVGHTGAAEALVLDGAGCMISDSCDGQRETVDPPACSGDAAAIDAQHSQAPQSPLTNGVAASADDAADSGSSSSISVVAAQRHVYASKRCSEEEAAPAGRECLLGPPVRGILKQHDSGMREATKQCVLERLPPLLLMHLNRFEHVAAGARKRQGHVAFPFQLSVHPDVARTPHGAAHAADAARYRLKAVLVHRGLRHDSGHYVCYVWRPTALVQAAAAALEWAPPGPSKPISIPPRGTGGARQQRPGRRSHDGGTRGGHAPVRLGGALQATSLSTMQSGALSESDWAQSGTLAAAQRSASSQRTSLDGVWRAVSRRSGTSPQPLRGGSALSGGTSASAGLADDGTVDWEELADQPAQLQARHGIHASEPGGGSSEGSEHATEARSSPLSPALGGALQGDASGGGDGGVVDNRSVAELLASESADDPGVWALCDDETVTTVPWQAVARASAYLLLYEQV